MASSNRSKAIIELGKKLVSQLGDEADRDILAAWMAHFIAEKIDAVEHSAPATRADTENDCATAILALWQHRHTLPSGARPFEELEPIARAIADFDPESKGHRYYSQARNAANDVVSGPEVRWLELAKGFDYSARLLVRLCLQNAARDAMDKSQDWISLAAEASDEHGIEIRIVRFLENEDDGVTETGERRKALQNRLDRLEALVSASTILSAEIQTEIDGLPA